MNNVNNSVSFLPWQSTFLISVGGICAILLMGMLLILLIESSTSTINEKIHCVFSYIFSAFVICLIIITSGAVFFLVDRGLGLFPSIIAGSSIILGVISLGALLLGVLSKMRTSIFCVWMSSLVLSFVSIVSLVGLSLEKI